MQNLKRCTVCKEYKPTTEYGKKSQNKDGLHIYCKPCNSLRNAQDRHRKISKPKIIITEKQCSSCNEIKSIDQFGTRVEAIDGFQIYCKECKYNYDIQYRKDNADHLLVQSALYYQQNKEVIKENVKVRKYIRKNTDVKFRLKLIISSRVNKLMTHIRTGKASKGILKFLDYSMDDLVNHLESKFDNTMTWDNYGPKGWHIDHIKPVSLFDITSLTCDEFKECWKLENLQPLWWYDNLKKSNTYDEATS
jgi:hypothetical protein